MRDEVGSLHLADDGTIPHLVIRKELQSREVHGRIGPNGEAHLHLHGVQNMALLYDEANLALSRVTVEPDVADVLPFCL